MEISIITAWITVVLVALLAVKYIIRKLAGKGSKETRKFNALIRKPHIWLGFFAVAFALLHGLLAGNPQGTPLNELSIGAVLFTWNKGTVLFILLVLISITWLLRKLLHKKWLFLHRILTVLIIAVMILHIYTQGIRFFKVFFSSENSISVPEDSIPSLTDEAGFGGAVLRDGNYTGSGEGLRGEIKVEVTVSGGTVTEITILSSKDDARYFNTAKSTIISEILGKQKLDVDAAAGATYSSHGIVNAVADALSDAVTSGSLTVPEYYISGNRH